MTTRVSNIAWVTVKPPVVQENTGWELAVLDPTDWSTVVARVNTFSAMTFSDSAAEQGSGSITFDAEDPILTQPLPLGIPGTIMDREYLWKVYENGGLRGEWLGQDVEKDVVAEDETSARVTISGQSTLCVLGWGVMVPMLAWDDAAETVAFSSKDFLGVTAATALVWLIGHVQIRGTIPFVELLFDETVDSKGLPWTDLQDVSVSPGETPLSLLQRLADAMGWEFRMLEGFRLFVSQSSAGSHRETQVKFFVGGDQKSHNYKASSRDLANVIFTPASDGSMATAIGTSDATPHIREGWAEAGDSSSATAASAVAEASLEMYQNRQVGRTLSIVSRNGRVPFDDFAVNDWVAVEDEHYNSESVQISSLSVSIDDKTQVSYELTVMTRFETIAVRLTRLLDKMGGSSLGSTSSTPIKPGSEAQATVRFSGLLDVSVSGADPGDVLTWSGATVLPQTPTVDFLADADTSTTPPTLGQALAWNGTKWVPATIAGGGSSALSGLTDVSVTGALTGKVLTYSQVTGKWSPVAPSVPTLDALTNVAVTGVTSGQYLKYNGTAWVQATLPTIPTTLDDLTDVDTSGEAAGRVLGFDGTAWTPVDAATGATTLNALTDVNTSGVVSGKVLGYTGTEWAPVDPATGGGASTLDDLTDVSTTGAVTDQVLKFDGSTWVPGTVTGGSAERGVIFWGPWVTAIGVEETITFESGALPSDWTFDRGPTIVPYPDTAIGTAQALRFADIGDNQATYVDIPVVWMSSTRSQFSIRVHPDSEGNYDWFRVRLDGTEMGRVSGGGNWSDITFFVSDGVHTIRLEYSKDGSESTGTDTAYISRIVMSVPGGGPDFQLGDIVRHDGILWVLAADFSQEPGTSTDWEKLTGDVLDDLTDVDTTGAVVGQVLEFNGTAWIPGNVTSGGGASTLDALADVNTAGATPGTVLGFDGTQWAPVAPSGGTSSPWTVIASKTFTDLTGWTVRAGTWTVGAYGVEQTDTTQVNAFLQLNAIVPGSIVSYEVVVYVDANTAGYFGIQMRNRNGTVFNPAWSLWITKAGVLNWDRYGQGGGTFSTGIPLANGSHTLKVIRNVADISVYLDTVFLTTISMNRLDNTAGIDYAGLELRNGRAWFQSIVISTSTGGGGGAATLDGLTDVNTAGAAAGQVLEFDGTGWVPGAATGGAATLDGLTDVVTAGVTSSQYLMFDGTNWVPATPPSGGTPAASTAAVRAYTSGFSTTITATATIPATAVVGDLLVCYMGSNFGLTPVIPSGWEILATQVDIAPNWHNGILYSRVCQAGDPGTTFTLTATGGEAIVWYTLAIQDWTSVQAAATQKSYATTNVVTCPVFVGGTGLMLLFGSSRVSSATITLYPVLAAPSYASRSDGGVNSKVAVGPASAVIGAPTMRLSASGVGGAVAACVIF